MKYFLTTIPIICASIGSLCSAQTSTDLNEGSTVTPSLTPDNYIFSWWGNPSRFYVIEHSADLLSPWSHIPAIEPGYGEVAEWGFATNSDKFFLRLKYTDDAVGSFYGDEDSDGIINGVEILLGYSAITANGNTDGDLLSDRAELALGLDPNDNTDAVDADSDGIVDAIERLYGLSTSGTTDLDGDFMDDEWELKYYLDLNTDDSALDADHDGRTNLQEFNDGTNPWAFDTDGDTIPDGVEHANSLNPSIPDPIHTRNIYAWQFTTDLTDRFSEFSDRISQSPTHSLALDKDGDVYGWGTNDSGQLGLGAATAGNDVAAPTLTMFNASRSVAAGRATSHVVTATSAAQAAGDNYLGLLGLGSTPVTQPSIEETPIALSGLSNVKRIRASNYQMREAITGISSNIYAWGVFPAGNYSGPNFTGSPQGALKGLSNMVQLSSSTGYDTGSGILNSATGGLNAAGSLKMWGYNTDHVLARTGSQAYATPLSGYESTSSPSNVSYIDSKHSHVTAISSVGSLFTWGRFNGVRPEAINETQSTPTQLMFDGVARGVASFDSSGGVDSLSEKPGYFIDEKGNLWVFSWFVSEVIYTHSTGETHEYGTPRIQKIPSSEVFVGIAEGYDSIYLLTSSGTVMRYIESIADYDYNYTQIYQGTGYASTFPAKTPTGLGVFEKIEVPNFYNAVDSNNDGINDLHARFFGLNPNSSDTNGDGISDANALYNGIDPRSWDNDGDGIPNVTEIAKGLNPNSTDSDGDGMLDNEEFYLYDRLSNYILTTDPNSQGPSINLISPAPGDITAL